MNEFKPKVWMTCPLCGKQSPMPDPDHREWVGLTDEDVASLLWKMSLNAVEEDIRLIEAKLKEKNR